MKLISLNIWGGKVYEPLIDFVKKHADDVDVFCFQEIFKSSAGVKVSRQMHMNIIQDLKNILPNYQWYFGSVQEGWDNDGPVDFEAEYGQATFVKKDINVLDHQHYIIHGEKSGADVNVRGSVPGGMMYTKLDYQGATYHIFNIHGCAYPGTKVDTQERIKQSEKVKEAARSKSGENIILCGDFNLLPQTQSVALLAEGMQNLIKDYNIARTRSTLSPYFNTPQEQKFADYTFVSPSIKVTDFQVLDDQVSDHLAMYLKF